MQTTNIAAVRPSFLQGQTKVCSDSERRLLELVRRAGSPSRADLTRASGLSVPGAKGLIDGLVERGLLRLGPAVPRGRGQPSASVSLVPGFAYSVGLSIMVDGFSVAVMNFAGEQLAHRSVRCMPPDLEFAAAQVKREVAAMMTRCHIVPDTVFGIGLSMTGPRIGEGSRVNPPLALAPDWAETELDRFFSERLGLPVWMDNDANCAALAEYLFGVGRECDDFAYLHFTDGFAAGLISGGRLLRGGYGNAGELGRIFALTGLTRPTLESLRARLVASGHELPDIHTMLDRYDARWPEIEDWIGEVRQSLSVAVAATIALLDPRALVFGSRLPADLAQRLIAEVAFEKRPRRGLPSPNPVLLVGQVVEHAALAGAGMLPFKEHFFAC
jgi:predicted NBD/HSP70 family sugar kinase